MVNLIINYVIQDILLNVIQKAIQYYNKKDLKK